MLYVSKEYIKAYILTLLTFKQNSLLIGMPGMVIFYFVRDIYHFQLTNNIVEIYHLQKYVELQGQKKLQIISDGPLKAELRFEHKISDVSSIEQTISLSCIGERLEFDNFVDWNESHQFLVMYNINNQI